MLGEVISTAGPNHMNCCDSYNFMAKFKSSPLSNAFKVAVQGFLYVAYDLVTTTLPTWTPHTS